MPAANNSVPPRAALTLTSMGESKARRSKPHCKPTAARLKPAPGNRIAMMLPSAAPIFAAMSRKQRETGNPFVPTSLFASVYLAPHDEHQPGVANVLGGGPHHHVHAYPAGGHAAHLEGRHVHAGPGEEVGRRERNNGRQRSQDDNSVAFAALSMAASIDMSQPVGLSFSWRSEPTSAVAICTGFVAPRRDMCRTSPPRP